ncbi:MAG TPA: pitrilysin family protein [Pirellulales bacterium]|nr:pitrilysin family protein [Pirellulales bacterium]
MPQPILSHEFDNGLVLVAEPMPSVESAAFSILVPAGSVYDAADRYGLATLTCEMTQRGCGSRDSRQFITDLENLGVQRGESVASAHMSFGGATLAKNLPATLRIYADLLRRPHLPVDQLDAARLAALQELRSIEDDPSHKVMLELKRRYYPDPWGRPSEGEQASLEAITIDEIRNHFQQLFRPNGTIIGVAGRVQWQAIKDLIGSLLADWKPAPIEEPGDGARGVKTEHLNHESNQTQIGIAYHSVPYRHPDYFQASGAVGVLSGGMSARLFTEVREKRGLCYTVFASHHTQRDRACVLCYAGTSAERAQETLDVTLGELQRIAQGILPAELARLKARVKSGLIMQGESSSARSGAIARDWYHLGQARTLAELGKLVDDLTVDSINEYLQENPPKDFTVVTLGPAPLTVPIAA